MRNVSFNGLTGHVQLDESLNRLGVFDVIMFEKTQVWAKNTLCANVVLMSLFAFFSFLACDCRLV